MKNCKRALIGCLLVLTGCGIQQEKEAQKNWPEKLQSLEIGLNVSHSMDTVYATLNTKDPEKRGKYQMKFATTVEALSENVELVEFGAYFREGNTWVLRTIYGRPFNKEEFDKWYNAENGKIILGHTYTDNDNWLGKSDFLNGNTYHALLYFIGKNAKGEQLVGAQEIVGVMKLKE
jgi:hypothetical protein